jgi:DNA modification methylase
MTIDLHTGDSLAVLRTLPSSSVHCCVTSPPYFWQRDYGIEGQLGLEDTLEEYIDKLTAIFAEVRRVLRPDGTLWLNIGDTYTTRSTSAHRQGTTITGGKARTTPRSGVLQGLKPKELIGVPWALAFALRAEGWWLRSENIWAKLNPMPESVTDRPTRAHEQVFLLSKSETYYYDRKAIEEPVTGNAHNRGGGGVGGKAQPPGTTKQSRGRNKYNASFSRAVRELVQSRNKRSVWLLISEPTKDKHSAAFPTAVARNAILAGCPRGGVVLDPFCGRGTSGIVAVAHGRAFVGIDIDPDNIALSERNILDAAERKGVLSLELARRLKRVSAKPSQLGMLENMGGG